MNDAAIDAAAAAVGVVAIGSLLLPGIDQLWDSHPADGEQRKRLRTGESVYFLILASAGTLYALKSRSAFPLFVVLALGVVVSVTFERALRSGLGEDS